MSKEFFGRDVIKRCAECKHVRPVGGTDMFLCNIKGPVQPGGYCRKYSYDILKRTPDVLKKKEYSDKDFMI